MKILVYNVSAKYSGSLTILNNFKNEISKNNNADEYIFLLSDKFFDDSKNIKNIVKKWINKSIFHRLFWELIYKNIYIRKIDYDILFSMQNIGLLFHKKKQIVLIQNCIPFQREYKLNPFLKEERIIFAKTIIYKILFKVTNLFNNIMYITQTNFMKELILYRNSKLDIYVCETFGKKQLILEYSSKYSNNYFIYPVVYQKYKNFKIIFESFNYLLDNQYNFDLVLTIDKKENAEIRRLCKKYKNLSTKIKFIGYSTQETIQNYFKNGYNLIFPSYIESLGLPIIEATMYGVYVFVANAFYSREVVNGYNKTILFDNNSRDLKIKLTEFMRSEKFRIKPVYMNKVYKSLDWFSILSYVGENL